MTFPMGGGGVEIGDRPEDACRAASGGQDGSGHRKGAVAVDLHHRATEGRTPGNPSSIGAKGVLDADDSRLETYHPPFGMASFSDRDS